MALSFKKSFFFVVALTLLALFTVAYLDWDQYRCGKQGEARLSLTGSLHRAVVREWGYLLNPEKGLIRPEEFETIDFSLPGDPGYGDNPDNEFFNPAGRFKAKTFTRENFPDLEPYFDAYPDLLASRPIFNVRRYPFKEQLPPSQERTVLYVLLPYPFSGCISSVFRSVISPDPPVIAPDNHTVVIDPQSVNFFGAKTEDGRAYMFYALAVRRKPLEE